MARIAAIALIALIVAAPAPAEEATPDDPAARVAELEAEVARLRETVRSLRERLDEAPIGESDAQLLQNRIRNQILEINQLRRERDACRGDLRAAERARDAAERRVADAARRAADAEREASRARRDESRAESEARSLRSRLRRCN